MQLARKHFVLIDSHGTFIGRGIMDGRREGGRSFRPSDGPGADAAHGMEQLRCLLRRRDEEEVKANADYMAQHMARYGWKYVVIDYYWYFSHTQPEPGAGKHG